MPTPMRVFAQAAARWGKVSADDDDAVDAFFTSTLPTLPKATQEEIIDFLLAHQGGEAGQAAPAARRAGSVALPKVSDFRRAQRRERFEDAPALVPGLRRSFLPALTIPRLRKAA